ncbi:hypothetical protein SeMB42_g00039 [Synchytrium endobioticum]|uniref:RRM domain-containing protein n=1 Tax=Synchytrium endobioticum TaxID=286115 RepID=A0A507D7C7_9FUNG|nr:hypothetical protein SeLEV6574_g02700 [Synchytrium endobioticum]TPX55037.1 hypothetical protein SeMB42_g00039 [Synchytrium endobioticum]
MNNTSSAPSRKQSIELYIPRHRRMLQQGEYKPASAGPTETLQQEPLVTNHPKVHLWDLPSPATATKKSPTSAGIVRGNFAEPRRQMSKTYPVRQSFRSTAMPLSETAAGFHPPGPSPLNSHEVPDYIVKSRRPKRHAWEKDDSVGNMDHLGGDLAVAGDAEELSSTRGSFGEYRSLEVGKALELQGLPDSWNTSHLLQALRKWKENIYVTWRYPDRALVAFDHPTDAQTAKANLATDPRFKTKEYTGEVLCWADDDSWQD